ncbi:MAG: hypothetical protein WD003_02680 [Candidatus Paceibacterota bacterium]
MPKKNEIEVFKGHLKDTKNPFKISYYTYNDANLLLVNKKTERLSEAVYMVTELFDDHEPLKWELRKKIVQLMSFITELSSLSEVYDTHNLHKRIQGALSEILFPLELAMQSRLISSMNFSILRDEFTSLGDVLGEHQREIFTQNDVSFPDNFFSYEEDLSLRNREERHPVQAEKEDKETMHPSTSDSSSIIKDKKDPVKAKNIKDIKSEKKVSFTTTTRPLEKKTGRRTAIIQLLKAKGELTIKEISSVVDGWSEKTIQRELMSLIDKGEVVREGERRWSTYRLVQG